MTLADIYRTQLPAITPGAFTFKLWLRRPHMEPVDVLPWATSLGWDDEQSALTGSVSLQRPDPSDWTSIPITRGMLLNLEVDWDGGTYDLWTMRAQAPQAEVETGVVTVALQDDMSMISAGARDWWFRKIGSHSNGWTADEVAQYVAQTLGVPLRAAAAGTVRFELKERRKSGLQVLRDAYGKEKIASGRSFVIRFRQGALEIVTLQRNPMLYSLSSQIQTALVTQKAGQKIPTTVLTGRGHVGQGSSAVKVSYTAYDESVVKLLGYVHDYKSYGRVDSHDDLVGKVNRELASRLRLPDLVTVQHLGVPFILRGDAAQVEIESEGMTGDQSFVFCTRATHTVQAGVYTTTWDFTFTDPYLAQLQADRKAAAARVAAAKKKARDKLKAATKR